MRQEERSADLDYRSLFEAAPGAYLVLRPNSPTFTIAAVNEAYLRATMTVREEIVGKGLFEVFPDNPDDLSADGTRNLAASLGRVLRSRSADAMAIQKYDIPRPSSEGGGFEERFWSPLNSPVLDPQGGVAFIIHRVEDVTEVVRLKLEVKEQRAEQALRESEERFRVIFRTSPDWITITRVEDGAYVAVNDGFLKTSGWSEAEVIGRSSLDIDLWVDPAERAALVEKLRADGHAENMEVRLRVKDGRILPSLVSARLITLNGESLLLAISRNIGDWKRAQDEIRQSESRLRAFVESDVIGILFGDVDGRVYDCNQELTRIIGRSREDVLAGKVNWVDITPPEDLPLDAVALAEAAASGRCRPYEKHYRRPDGTSIPVQVGHALLEPERQKSVAFILDISERKRAEQVLAESEERFRAIFEQVAVGMAQVDVRTGRFLRVNDKLCEILGYSREEMLTRSWQDLTHPEDLSPDRHSYAHMLSSHASYSKEKRYVRKDGQPIWVNLTVAPLWPTGAEPTSHVSVMEDITGKKRLEEQFRQAQKLESVGRLAGGVAHDFNNLLTVILSCAHALKEDLGAGRPALPEEIEEIRAAGERAADLTRSLLAFARKQVIAPVPLDLNGVVRGSHKMLGRLLGEDVEILVNLEPAPWTVRCDPGQVEQVLLNLAVNARDAMPGGGRLDVATANVRVGPDELARFPVAEPGDYVKLVIRDSGTGMTPEVKVHLFEPFFTTKRKGEGTGLGLATVYGIVEQSGGHIDLTSAPGEGTAFQIFFPRTSEAPSAGVASPAAALARGTESILLVEDDPQVRDVTARSLRAGGYRVVVAASGRDALRLDAAAVAGVQLLVTDVVMPGIDGRALADELRRGHPSLRVLYVSGYTQDALGKRVLEPGIEFLPKPFTAPSLLARVRAVLDAR
ncbi:MAG: PAS domain S-box protein [Myxococcales bacterium]